jgi:hypothetical protein
MRKVMDCRKYPSESRCSVKISGTEEEVEKLAIRHAIEDHGRRAIRESLEDEEDERPFSASPMLDASRQSRH